MASAFELGEVPGATAADGGPSVGCGAQQRGFSGGRSGRSGFPPFKQGGHYRAKKNVSENLWKNSGISFL